MNTRPSKANRANLPRAIPCASEHRSGGNGAKRSSSRSPRRICWRCIGGEVGHPDRPRRRGACHQGQRSPRKPERRLSRVKHPPGFHPHPGAARLLLRIPAQPRAGRTQQVDWKPHDVTRCDWLRLRWPDDQSRDLGSLGHGLRGRPLRVPRIAGLRHALDGPGDDRPRRVDVHWVSASCHRNPAAGHPEG